LPTVPAAPDLSVVIPAHHEGKNLAVLLPRLRAILDGLGVRAEILVVVRAEDPETRRAADEAGGRVAPQDEAGYGGALRTGFRLARGPYVLTLDADLSHPPAFAADLWRARHEAEVLIASRYVAGGRAEMPLPRWLLSRVLNAFFALGLGVPLRDLSSGFRLYRAGALPVGEVRARDFDVLPEIVIRAWTSGWRVKEIPFRYAPRAHGASNARVIPFGVAYLRTFRSLWALRNDVLAADYEDRAFDSRIPLQRYWQRRRVNLVAGLVGPGGPALDVGCGSSRLLGALPPGSVGVDRLATKLRRARRFGRPLVRASALRLPFRDGAFACVVAAGLVEAEPRGSGLLAELARVVAPGGRLVLSTPDYGRRRWRFAAALYSRIVPGASRSGHRARYTRDDLVAALRERALAPEAEGSILGAERVLAFRKAG
jgi:dolichol-phosphate mannosyltransferase